MNVVAQASKKNIRHLIDDFIVFLNLDREHIRVEKLNERSVLHIRVEKLNKGTQPPRQQDK